MKKQLREELMILAQKITSLKDADISTGDLKRIAGDLYEKLVVLDFTETNLHLSNHAGGDHVFGASQKGKAPEQKHSVMTENEEHYAPTGMEYNDSEEITEPNTEKIKDIVAQMPPESQEVDEMFAHIQPRSYQKNDKREIEGVHFDQLPQFEPLLGNSGSPEKPKSLNDRLKKGIHIGVNDRHAFIRHLFDGNAADYNRVLSQLNTLKNKEEAFNFVANMVKPDYDNWEGKELYESRFLEIVENKFN